MARFRSIAVGVFIVVLQSARGADVAVPSTAPATQAGMVFATAALSEKTFAAWKAAIEAYPFPDQPTDLRANALAALEKLRRVKWPDFSQLRFVRIQLASRADRTWVAWCVSMNDAELQLVTAAFTPVRLERAAVTMVKDEDFDAYLDTYVKLARGGSNRDRLFAEYQVTPKFFEAFSVLSVAMQAGARGKDAEGLELLQLALKENGKPNVFDAAMASLAFESFAAGADIMRTGASREQILTLWQQTVNPYSAPGQMENLAAYVAQLKLQAAEDARRAKLPAVDPAKLPQDQQIAYYVDHLDDVRGQQHSHPGAAAR